MKGRPANVKDIHEARGNPGHRRHPENPKAKPGRMIKPQWIQGKAAKIWKRYAPKLRKMGILCPVDAPMFGAWCALMAQFENDPTSFTTSKIAQMRSLAGEFGLTPGTRARIKMPDVPEESPEEKYF